MLNRGTHVLHFWEKVREFYGNLNEKKLCDIKKFWGAVKPTLSNKVASNEKITLVEQDNIVENDKKAATFLNDFFSNIITNLGIPQYIEGEPVSQNIDDPLMKAIIKYRFHPSIIAINQKCVSSFSFSFSQVEGDEIIKNIKNLKTNKATQSADIPTKLNPFSANFTKWSNTLKQFVGDLPTNCLSVFDHFVGLALKRLRKTLIFLEILILKTLTTAFSTRFFQARWKCNHHNYV